MNEETAKQEAQKIVSKYEKTVCLYLEAEQCGILEVEARIKDLEEAQIFYPWRDYRDRFLYLNAVIQEIKNL